MDGQGDGGVFNGAVWLTAHEWSHASVSDPFTASLGHIYSAITNLYGLKTNRHEGKILGLAALGDGNQIYSALKKLIHIEKGVINVMLPEINIKSAGQALCVRDLRHN